MAKRVLFFVICCVFGSYLADAQNFYAIRRPRNLMVNFGSGIASYKGDLVNPHELGIIKPNITAGAEYYWKKHFSVKTQLTWFQIKGDDSRADDDRWERNLSFQSGNLEFAVTGTANLFKTDKYYQRRKFNIHGFTGIGVLYFNPKTFMDGEKYKLRKYKTEGVAYSRIQPTIPVGLGARIFYNHFFNILIEGGYRFTFTDYLDDASRKRYLPVEELGGDVNSIRYRLSDRRPEIDTQPARPSEVGVRGDPRSKRWVFYLQHQSAILSPKRNLPRQSE